MLDKFKNIFSFSKGERRGIYLLLSIIFIQIFALNLIPYLSESKPIDFSDFEKKINEFYKSSKEQKNKKQTYYNSSKNNQNIELFKFDPNSTSKSDWKKLGFSDKQITVINKYLSKGGKFYKKEDLAKIYVISDEQYKRVEDYVEIKSSSKKYAKRKTEYKSKYESKNIPLELFVFDPNNVSSADWLKLGLSQKQVKVITNYLSKGGHFYKKEDLKKIYSISSEQYQTLESYIKIESTDKKTYKSNNIIVEINSADSLTLIKIRGVGPSFAKRIIKYRSMLGGFYKKEQLMEVYGLDQEKYDEIKASIKIDAKNISKINMNIATIKELVRHPYIEYNTAKKIVEVREFNGEFTSVDDLLAFKLVDEKTHQKIKNYLGVK